MDLDKKRRNQLIKVILVDILMIFSVIGLVFVLVAMVSGWRLASNLSFEHRGLVQIESLPTGADVIIDGKKVSMATTNVSRLLPEGKHKVLLQKEGYEQWGREIYIKSGIVTRIEYPRLYKQERVREDVFETTKELEFVSFSEDRKRCILMEKEATELILISGINNGAVATRKIGITEAFSSEFFKDKKFIGEGVRYAWSKNGEKILLESNIGNNKQWVLIDVMNNDSAVNLNKKYADWVSESKKKEQKDTTNSKKDDKKGAVQKNEEVAAVSVVKIGNESGNKILVLDNKKRVFEADFTSGANEFVKILSNVDDFYVAEGAILYTSKNDGNEKRFVVGVYKYAERNSVIIRELNESDNIRLLATEYYGKKYIGYMINNRFFMYSMLNYPSSEAEVLAMRLVAEIGTGVTPESGMSLKSAFLYQQGSKFFVYNLETERSYEYEEDFDGVFKIDDFNLAIIKNGDLFVLDFDGRNKRKMVINEALFNADVKVSSNHKYLYYMVFSDNKRIIRRENIN